MIVSCCPRSEAHLFTWKIYNRQDQNRCKVSFMGVVLWMKHFYTRHPFCRKKKKQQQQQQVTLVRSVGSHGLDRWWSQNICSCANNRKDCGVVVSGELNKTNSYQNCASIANESYLSKVTESVEFIILFPNAIFLQLFGKFQIMKAFLPGFICLHNVE